jgi:hypothetical protein
MPTRHKVRTCITDALRRQRKTIVEDDAGRAGLRRRVKTIMDEKRALAPVPTFLAAANTAAHVSLHSDFRPAPASARTVPAKSSVSKK